MCFEVSYGFCFFASLLGLYNGIGSRSCKAKRGEPRIAEETCMCFPFFFFFQCTQFSVLLIIGYGKHILTFSLTVLWLLQAEIMEMQKNQVSRSFFLLFLFLFDNSLFYTLLKNHEASSLCMHPPDAFKITSFL